VLHIYIYDISRLSVNVFLCSLKPILHHRSVLHATRPCCQCCCVSHFFFFFFKLRCHLDCLCVIISDYEGCISNEPIFAYYTRQHSTTRLEGNRTYLKTCQTGARTGIAFSILHIIVGSADNRDFRILFCRFLCQRS